MKPAIAIATGAALLCIASATLGHEGEDHAAPAPAMNQSAASRVAAASEEFEIVVALEGKKLLLYLDRFASNEPVVGAKLEIEGGGVQGIAAESSAGVYVIDAAALAAGKHPLTITIEAGESADLLSATLDVAPAPTPAQAATMQLKAASKPAVWLSAGALALAGAVVVIARRRKNGKVG